MEHTTAWGGPFEFQLAAMNWTAEGPAGDAEAWAAPAAGHPLEYTSIVDIFGSSCSHQPYVVPASSSSHCGGQQNLVEYNYYNYYAAAAQHDGPVEKAPTQMETYMNTPEKLFLERKEELEHAYDAQFMKQKMHRYPPSIRDLDNKGLYTAPRVVAIGPYHHYGGDHLKEAEKVKHLAAFRCMERSGLGVQDLYQVVVSAAAKINARGLYDDKDVMAGMGYDEFLPMMFYDACFLVMYMLHKTTMGWDQVLFDFFESNDNDIAHDIMLLENQIPWPVVDAVMNNCNLEPLERIKSFIALYKYGYGCLQDRVNTGLPHVNWNKEYKAPHLLALLRFYILGSSSRKSKMPVSDLGDTKSIQISVGASELAEMGIFLTANKKKDELPVDMGLDCKWIIFAKLPIVPLSLNDLRASWLVNMAAIELCTTPYFFEDEAKRADSAVCSYLLLLSMLMHREEDVHELRTKGILQGAGLTNKKTLDFFTSLQSLRKGPCYTGVMVEIEDYRMTRWGWWLRLYKFVYKNWKVIAGIVSAVSAFASILGTLMKLKGAH